MGSLFSRSKNKKVSRVTEQDKAVLALKHQRDKIKQYQKKVTEALKRERLVAKQLLQDNKKEKAMLLLRKKRFMEGMLDKTDNQLTNLERMVHDIEFAQIEVQVSDGLKIGNEALKKIHDMMSVEDIEKLLDETNEGIEKQREIDELLSATTFTDADEEAIVRELDEIVGVGQLPSVPEEDLMPQDEDISLPDVPTTQPEKLERQRVAVAAQ